MMHLRILPLDSVDAYMAQPERYKAYWPHSIGHHLGLDVHDVGALGKDTPLVPGMVITIEPGLYIPTHLVGDGAQYRGLGVRIEDDVVVSPPGQEVHYHGFSILFYFSCN